MARRRRPKSSSSPLPAPRRDAIRRRLLAWYDGARRDLPWRRSRDPYRIWLAETMLQQTRVETVLGYYERFLSSFPTCEALAAADEQDVLLRWAGLGYYARARNLWRAARRIARDHGGRIPSDAEDLEALPGVGRYTAGAVRSIAFGAPAPIVDGNVSRVLSRVEGLRSAPSARIWTISGALVPDDRPGDFNQALMELGATVCKPRAPTCPVCPLHGLCTARRSGSPEAFAVARRRAPPVALRATAGVVRDRRGGAVLLVRRPGRGLLGGLWELPSVEGTDVSTLTKSVRERFGLRAEAGARLGRVSHSFTHRRLTLDLFELRRRSGNGRVRGGGRWCRPEDVADLPLSSLTRKSLRLAWPAPADRG